MQRRPDLRIEAPLLFQFDRENFTDLLFFNFHPVNIFFTQYFCIGFFNSKL